VWIEYIDLYFNKILYIVSNQKFQGNNCFIYEMMITMFNDGVGADPDSYYYESTINLIYCGAQRAHSIHLRSQRSTSPVTIINLY
jgi:hypothetical protein